MTALTREKPYQATAQGQRAIPLTRLASRLLMAALAISVTYQIYRSTVMEVPAHDQFSPFVAGMYAAFMGLAWMAGRSPRWGAWLVLAEALFFTCFGIFAYFPVVTPLRTFGPIDWAEGVIYCGMIFAAGVLAVCALLKVTLTSDVEQAR